MLGASQGMGLAIAEALVAEGANVAMFARRADVVEREAARLGRALAVPGDLTRPADLERLVDDDRRGASAASTSSCSTAAARRRARPSASRPSR